MGQKNTSRKVRGYEVQVQLPLYNSPLKLFNYT